MVAGLGWAGGQSSQSYPRPGAEEAQETVGWWSLALHFFKSRHRPNKELWALLIPGGTVPAAAWLCPGHRDCGWTLGGADPQQGEGKRAIKSLIKGRQLSEGGNKGGQSVKQKERGVVAERKTSMEYTPGEMATRKVAQRTVFQRRSELSLGTL